MKQPQHDDLAELLAFERSRRQALVSGDIAALAPMLAEDLVHVHSTGMVHGKQQLLEHIRRMGGFVAIDREDPHIRLEGEVAILTGDTRNRVRSLDTGEEMTRFGFQTLVLRRTAAGWQIVLSQLTPHRS
ncbi:nuclear transport factor 2 family protein [Acerihabitans sp. KWT182]|uniref:Nuclear transport factor 2 family protein n=1 Tax=Acerihabitans sp. KWT182 TaxID=3157919 RepID=A0AAU7QES5_9GAMM